MKFKNAISNYMQQEHVPGFWALMGILMLGLFCSLGLSGRLAMLVEFITSLF